MSNGEKKAYLRSYQLAKRQVRMLEDEIAELRSARMFPSPPPNDGMPKGNHAGGDLSDYAAKLDRLERKLRKREREAMKALLQVERDIDAVPDQTERELLTYRYISGYTWEQVAALMTYDVRSVYRIHGRALAHFMPD